jgi:HAD superfamily hydrolase (TIGR01549 family)
VTERFETFYQGSGRVPGLKHREKAMIDIPTLQSWKRSFRLGIVTGRPRADALEFLDRFAMADLFDTIVTREDAPLKPDPAPIQMAMANLGVNRGWMLGDTPDDITAARRSGIVPIGVVAPGDNIEGARSVLSAAAVVLGRVTELQEIIDATKV